MAGFTDRAFRALCKGCGCGLTFSEMVSAKSIIYNKPHSPALQLLLDADELERPFAVQFFSHEPEVLSEAIQRLERWRFDMVDINMGCPVPKVVRNGEGCALMTNPSLAGKIVEAAVRASHRPVTVKIRKGFTAASANAAEIARVAEESGAAAVSVHGRTRDQFYSGAADWDCIAEVKAAVKIPVIGNGDVFDAESAARMLAYTRCDGVMAARGALGNPWLFAQIKHFLETGEHLPPPEWEERIKTALSHLRAAVKLKGERTGLLEMRKHLSFYVKGHPSAANLRRRINLAGSVEELEKLLKEFD
jgi:nifR3 family TIM-barrel protein